TMASIDDLVVVLQFANQNSRQLANTIANIFPRSIGTFTLAAAASTTINDANVKSMSAILWIPTNAAAGALEGSAKKLYLSARTAGTSFAVATASAAAAAGTEAYVYAIY